MSKEEILAAFNATLKNTLMETLEMEYVDVDHEKGMLQVKMPVNPRVHQPMGLLHGGATAAVAETVGSAASAMYARPEDYAIVGLQLTCNHIKSKREGYILGTASLQHKGRSTHLWDITITDEIGQVISHCKLTNMIMPLKK
jgi:uncharacterized protein (TIGR00369 family)